MSDAYTGNTYFYPDWKPVFVTFLGTTSAIVVSGDKLNPCGHMLLNTGGVNGSYFHIADPIGYPHCMDYYGYQRYLLDNKKTELSRTPVRIPNPSAAKKKLIDLLGEKWVWGLLPNNCVHFVEEVLQAGGAHFGLYSNCPRLNY